MSDGQKPIVNVRFPPSLAAAARVMAEQDGMSLSAWIRREVERELSRRDGVCVTCGQAVAAEATPAPPGPTASLADDESPGDVQSRTGRPGAAR